MRAGMKKTVATLVILFALFAAWSAWPFFALYDIARVAQAGDAAALEQRVDFPSLRRSLSNQIGAAYARVSGVRVERGLLGAAAAAAADPFIAKLLTPEALVELLRNGWPTAAAGALPPGLQVTAPNLNALGNVFRLYAAADYGIGEFRLPLPLDAPAEQRFRLELGLSNWNWKLSAIDLPADLADRLARELMKPR
jgi:hypothetical protein